MTSILVAESTDATLARTLADVGLKVGRTEITHLGTLGHTTGGPPDILVVDLRGMDDIPAEVSALRRQHARLGIIAVVTTLEPGVLLRAMRAGVSEVVADPLLTEHLVSAVSRVAARQFRAAAGRVFAFVGAKGGVGTTTLAVNVASVLGGSGTRALLVDMHDGDGDAATFLNAQPVRTLADACQNVHRLDERFLRGIVTPVGGRLDLLAAPEGTGAHAIDAVTFRAVLQRAAATYPYVIVDVSAAHVPLLESVESLTRLFIVTNQEFVSLKRGRRLADGLKSWCRDGRLLAIVNRFGDHGEIGERDVERVLGIGVAHTVPDDYPRVCAAVGRGRPVVCADRSELGDALTAFAAQLSGTSSDAEKTASPRPRLLQRLARAG